ncbi:delta(3,5)-dienoyl-CoA isomerase [Sporothrix schenckii 1099-18]|uniref:Enoyl-CoA hydratase n=2 Tax=Sporothrix schenckii TaxID=29908 RepID=U7Q510_SPOS1|nr:delta(3,5)-dienoyl-CoA isomerase [Sporothrix schenckii 1099-18]ERT01811.1 hypothetical protein HMPREF1624_00105 [Sporothrix schenckii ATCC 58251]KJR81054.1 delta(3,5)-dienoyl-CoA isomerase [Sporothrix schenckii 1099-18]
MSFKYIRITKPAEYVAHVELNRPEKLNAFIPDLWLELGQAFKQLSTDSDVRAIVLSGAGDRAFTTGLDVVSAGQWFSEMGNLPDTARRTVYMRRHIQGMQDSLTAIEKCEKPVICVMHGISLGMAVDVACCADVRICASDTRFAVKEVDIGLAADLGSLARLPHIVASQSWVAEVSLTARDFLAAEAQAVGFVSRVLPDKAAALAYGLQMATLIAAKSPVAVQGTKELLVHGRDHTVDDTLKYTAVWNASAIQCDDVQVALMSGMQKTKPHFSKL